MSMISEQVKELRYKADVFEKSGFAVDGIVKEFRKAADTIEALSAKLTEENKKQSSRYCGEEKQLIEAMAEEIENCYGRETELSERARDYLDKTDYDGGWIPCSERFPEKRGDYLVTYKKSTDTTIEYYVCTDYFDKQTLSWIFENQVVNLTRKVIAWQPLMKPYKEKYKSMRELIEEEREKIKMSKIN